MGDSLVEKLLCSCQLQHLIENFKEKGVGIDVLQILDENELTTLVPVWGQRVKLKKALTNYIHQLSKVNVTSADQNINSEEFSTQENVENFIPEGVETIACIETPASHVTETPERVESPVQIETPTGSSIATNSRTSHTYLVESDGSLSLLEVNPKKRRRTEENFSPKLLHSPSTPSVIDFDLKELLQQSCMGRAILATYETKNYLDSRCQSYLCDIIVNHFLDGDYPRLVNKDHEKISLIIEKLFPNEKAGVYYTPPIKKHANRRSNKSISSKGKLVDRYRNKVTFLRKAKVLPNLRFSNDDEDDEATVSSNDDYTDFRNDEDLTWLKCHVEPWTSVEEKWNNTYEYRQQLFKKDISLEEIYNEWPILKQNLSYTLIDNHFSKLYPNLQNTLFKKWEEVFNKLLKLKNNSVANNADNLLLKIITSNTLNTNRDYRHYLMVLTLASLIPSTAKFARGKKQQWKLTLNDIKESLVITVELPGDLENKIIEREEKWKKRGMTRQPFIVVEIEDVNVKNVYVSVIHPHGLYKVSSVLNAVDICFKVFHVFNLKYPLECEHLWLFIQHAIYDFETEFDQKIPTIVDIVNKIKNL